MLCPYRFESSAWIVCHAEVAEILGRVAVSAPIERMPLSRMVSALHVQFSCTAVDNEEEMEELIKVSEYIYVHTYA